MMRKVSFLMSLWVTTSVLGSVSAQAKTSLPLVRSYIQAPMPDWYTEGFTRGHLNIPFMMGQGFSRFEAVEVQNQMKDILEENQIYQAYEARGEAGQLFAQGDTLVLSALEKAIYSVKVKKHYESGFQPKPLKKGAFYVVFDLDETLLTHWYKLGEKGRPFTDLENLTLDSILRPHLISPSYASMTPGWEKAFLELSKTPGCQGIIVFTAKEDRSAQSIIDALKIQGKPLRGFLKGVFTRNHLVRDRHSVKLSKDLRVINEDLKHVVLVDDNPTRIFPKQQSNLREFPKYNPDVYLAAKYQKKEPKALRYFENLMPVIVSEIQETAKYSQAHHISFSSAYYPHSMAASAELLMLQKQGYSMLGAIQVLRDRSGLFHPKFFFHRAKK